MAGLRGDSIRSRGSNSTPGASISGFTGSLCLYVSQLLAYFMFNFAHTIWNLAGLCYDIDKLLTCLLMMIMMMMKQKHSPLLCDKSTESKDFSKLLPTTGDGHQLTDWLHPTLSPPTATAVFPDTGSHHHARYKQHQPFRAGVQAKYTASTRWVWAGRTTMSTPQILYRPTTSSSSSITESPHPASSTRIERTHHSLVYCLHAGVWLTSPCQVYTWPIRGSLVASWLVSGTTICQWLYAFIIHHSNSFKLDWRQ